MLRHLPNLVTILRMLLVVPLCWLIDKGQYEGALVIGFSCGRPHALVLRAAKLARKRDCATVAISDASISELTKLSDHCLYYSSNSPSYTRSHSALLSLIQALAYAVYSSDEAAYQERIRAYKLK